MAVTTYSSTSIRFRQKTATRWLVRGLGVLIIALVAWRVVTVGLAEGYPASFWLSQVINGLVLGGVYALV
ncbi:MAG: hypothetical protein NZ553_15815, partial [Caldilinea sp.]|nr:hypothetical protein [Caldilinea sp.]MDW8441943.1 hypothetical protein [Caldilineaceae bacterium]